MTLNPLGVLNGSLFDLLLLVEPLGQCWWSSNVLVAEQPANLLESLVLRLWEEEVADDGVGQVGADVDNEVLPPDGLEGVRGDLGDDDVVQLTIC